MSQMFQWIVVGMVVAAMTSTSVAQDKPANTQVTPAKTQPSVFQKWDANHDGKATADERQAQQQKWHKELDANNDGKLTPDEFQGQRFVDIDINKDGTVTLEEYLVYFVGKDGAVSADQVAASDKMDANGDNAATQAEVIAYRKSVFKAIDADGCGKATPADMKAANDKQFKSLDADNDGFVTVAEMLAVIAVPAPAKAEAPKAEEKKADQPAQ